MIKYFDNLEIKRNSIILILISTTMLLINYFTIRTSYEKIKINYIESNTAIVGNIIKNHPELRTEIIPLVTKGITNDQIKMGKSILKNYGFNEKLDVKFIPGMENNYLNLIRIITICLSIFCIIVFVGNIIQYISMYKKLNKFILAAQNMIENNFDVELYENREGVFSKLSHSFNNMRTIMKNNLITMQKEKDFLVNILSDISHQLKTPIASLIIYNDILLTRNIDEIKRREFLDSSSKQLNRIEWLVKSLLKLAKLDAGVIKFEKKNCDLNETVKESIQALEMKAIQENVKLTFDNRDGSKILIKHDEDWLKEAIINLIKNALEHTNENGLVEVVTERTPVCVRILVKDNGEGISKEELPHIFKRFFKGKRSKNAESVGIGLALSRSIVEGHEGIIEVISKEGQGTIFKITFLLSNFINNL